MRLILFSNNERGKAVAEAVGKAGYSFQAVLGPDVKVKSPHTWEWLRSMEPDLFIVAGYPHIFPKELLAIPKHGVWNCHAGPVPEYRGGSPLNWQIIDGRTMIGVSLLQMDEGIDTGPVIDEREFSLGPEETIADAHRKANECFADMVPQALAKLRWHGHIGAVYQPESTAYRPQRNDDMGEIDFSWPRERIVNFVRALTHPYPGAWFTSVDGERVRVWSVG